MSNKISEEKIQKIIQAYQNGMPPMEIYSKFNIDQDIFYYQLRKRGIKRNQKSNKITKEKEKEIISMYQNTEVGSDAIATKFNLSPTSILRVLKRNNIPVKGKLKGKDEEIIEQYNSGLSAYKVAENFGVTHMAIMRVLKKHNIERRSAEECHRIYEINEHFFDKIDTEEKAYMLGFIYADGYNSKDKKNIRIDLSVIDKDILIKFAKLIYRDNNPPESHVHIYDRTHEGKGVYAVLNIHSKYMCEKLNEAGCPNKKSHILTWPEWLDEKLIRHFVRGYFDGDGGIKHNNNPGGGYSFSICGSEKFIKRLQSIMKNKLNIHTNNRFENGTWVLANSGSRLCLKFFNWMYGHSSIHLERKYKQYIELQEKIKDTNTKAANGTRGYQKSVLEKYGFVVATPFDESNKPNEPNLYNKSGVLLIRDESDTPLTAEYIWKKQGTDRNKLVEYVFNYYRNNDFPYPKYNQSELYKELDKLKLFDPTKLKYSHNVISGNNNLGLKITKNFTANKFYSAKVKGSRSCIEVFHNDNLFIEAIKNRMGYNLEKDNKPYVYSIGDSTILRGMISSGLAVNVSQFRPTVAKYIYNYLKPNKIFDYSAGWGARALGAISMDIEYVGFDPNTHAEIMNLSNFFNYTKVNVSNNCSEDLESFKKLDNNFDLCFSSPPYFEREMYADNETQSYIKYKHFQDWLNQYWEKTVKNCCDILRNNGKFAAVLGINTSKEMLDICKKYLKPTDVIYIKTPSSHLAQSKNQYKEVCYIFNKK